MVTYWESADGSRTAYISFFTKAMYDQIDVRRDGHGRITGAARKNSGPEDHRILPAYFAAQLQNGALPYSWTKLESFEDAMRLVMLTCMAIEQRPDPVLLAGVGQGVLDSLKTGNPTKDAADAAAAVAATSIFADILVPLKEAAGVGIDPAEEGKGVGLCEPGIVRVRLKQQNGKERPFRFRFADDGAPQKADFANRMYILREPEYRPIGAKRSRDGESWRTIKQLWPLAAAGNERAYDALARVADCASDMSDEEKIQALQSVVALADVDQRAKVKEFMQLALTASYRRAFPAAADGEGAQKASALLAMV